MTWSSGKRQSPFPSFFQRRKVGEVVGVDRILI